eukprot:1146813-Prymnesium_polylepis.1
MSCIASASLRDLGTRYSCEVYARSRHDGWLVGRRCLSRRVVGTCNALCRHSAGRSSCSTPDPAWNVRAAQRAAACKAAAA